MTVSFVVLSVTCPACVTLSQVSYWTSTPIDTNAVESYADLSRRSSKFEADPKGAIVGVDITQLRKVGSSSRARGFCLRFQLSCYMQCLGRRSNYLNTQIRSAVRATGRTDRYGGIPRNILSVFFNG